MTGLVEAAVGVEPRIWTSGAAAAASFSMAVWAAGGAMSMG